MNPRPSVPQTRRARLPRATASSVCALTCVNVPAGANACSCVHGVWASRVTHVSCDRHRHDVAAIGCLHQRAHHMSVICRDDVNPVAGRYEDLGRQWGCRGSRDRRAAVRIAIEDQQPNHDDADHHNARNHACRGSPASAPTTPRGAHRVPVSDLVGPVNNHPMERRTAVPFRCYARRPFLDLSPQRAANLIRKRSQLPSPYREGGLPSASHPPTRPPPRPSSLERTPPG